jgi:GT2 family glycosyltransferase
METSRARRDDAASLDLSVSIVSWNTRDLLAQCLESIQRDQCLAVGHRLELDSDPSPLIVEALVVDNASDDGSPVMVRQRFPWVQLIENRENVGFARANNQVLRRGAGRYLLLLNPDTLVLPGSLQAMVAFLDAHPAVGVLGCQLLNADGSSQWSYADFPTLWSAWLGTDFRRHARPCAEGEALAVDAISGACLMVRREVVQEVGEMDEAFILHAEEVDWCYRIQGAGWLVCHLPQVEIVHLLGQSRRLRSWHSYLHIHRSRLLFFRKHRGLRQTQVLRGGYLVVSLAKAVSNLVRISLGGGTGARAKLSQNLRLGRWLVAGQDVLPGRAARR